MKKILHIVKNPKDPHALKVIADRMKEDEVSILLIQDAVRIEPPLPDKAVFVLDEDAAERRVTPKFESIGYERMLKMILEADSVVVW